MIPCNILGPTSHTLAIVLSVVIIAIGVSLLLLTVIINIVVWKLKKCGTGTYRPQQAEKDQGMKLEGDKQEGLEAANPPPLAENDT